MESGQTYIGKEYVDSVAEKFGEGCPTQTDEWQKRVVCQTAQLVHLSQLTILQRNVLHEVARSAAQLDRCPGAVDFVSTRTVFRGNENEAGGASGYWIWVLLLLCWDILYLIRCILDAFFVAFYVSDVVLETRPSKIFAKFWSSKLNILYRFIILLPLYLISSEYGYIRLVTLVEYNDMQLVIRGFTRLTTFWIKDGLLKYTLNKVIWLLLIITAYLILFSHISACVFLILETMALGEASDYLKMDAPTRYTKVLYFLITSQTSVGYGDVTVNHQSDELVVLRYLYQLFLMLVSIMINGVYYTILLVTIKEATEVFYQNKNEIERFEDWLTAIYRRMLPTPAQNPYYLVTMLYYKLSYILNVGQVLNYGNYLSNLWPEAANQVQLSMSSALSNKFPAYFSILSPESGQLIISKMQPSIYLKGDVVLRRRDKHEGVWFILDGYIQVTYKQSGSPLQHLQIGDEFGDGCLMESKSHFNFVCKTNCLCLFVPKDQMFEVLSRSPKDEKLLIERARMRLRKLVNIRERSLLAKHAIENFLTRELLSSKPSRKGSQARDSWIGEEKPKRFSQDNSADSATPETGFSSPEGVLSRLKKRASIDCQPGTTMSQLRGLAFYPQLIQFGSGLLGFELELGFDDNLSRRSPQSRNSLTGGDAGDLRSPANQRKPSQEANILGNNGSRSENKLLVQPVSNEVTKLEVKSRLAALDEYRPCQLEVGDMKSTERHLSANDDAEFIQEFSSAGGSPPTFAHRRGILKPSIAELQSPILPGNSEGVSSSFKQKKHQKEKDAWSLDPVTETQQNLVQPEYDYGEEEQNEMAPRNWTRYLYRTGRFMRLRLEEQVQLLYLTLADVEAVDRRYKSQTALENFLTLGELLNMQDEQDVKPKPAILTIERIKNYVFSHESRLQMMRGVDDKPRNYEADKKPRRKMYRYLTDHQKFLLVIQKQMGKDFLTKLTKTAAKSEKLRGDNASSAILVTTSEDTEDSDEDKAVTKLVEPQSAKLIRRKSRRLTNNSSRTQTLPTSKSEWAERLLLGGSEDEAARFVAPAVSKIEEYQQMLRILPKKLPEQQREYQILNESDGMDDIRCSWRAEDLQNQHDLFSLSEVSSFCVTQIKFLHLRRKFRKLRVLWSSEMVIISASIASTHRKIEILCKGGDYQEGEVIYGRSAN